MVNQQRDVVVVGGTLAGAAAALAATRSGARTRLLMQGARRPPPTEPIPSNVQDQAKKAVKAYDVPPPEEANVLRFRARRVRRWLDELGIENDDEWAMNLHDALLERCNREGAALDEDAVAVRLIGTHETGINGVVLVDGDDSSTHRAETTILAGGGAAYVWPGNTTHPSPPSGLALALRANLPIGDIGHIAWDTSDDDPRPVRFLDGVRGDGRGHTDIPGVAACGETLASPWHADETLCYLEDVIRGLEAGGFQGPPGQGSQPELVPIVDTPMPPGFCEVKLGRLRGTLAEHAGPNADQSSLKNGHAALLSLRGEFKDYARARAEADVQLLSQTADVALAHVDARLNKA